MRKRTIFGLLKELNEKLGSDSGDKSNIMNDKGDLKRDEIS